MIILDSQDLEVLPKVPGWCGLQHHDVRVSEQFFQLEDKTESIFKSDGGNVNKISFPL